ncbi:MAG: 3-deoxy-manno-octulosonate cytidylyltransferase, partial [bacterium]|nr:3-deoxy-manno-octulosonate cytidylyltransferase [bacterium]
QGVIHIMHRINKKKKFDQKEKITTTNLNKIGHFYFGKNRTFLFWLDSNAFPACQNQCIMIAYTVMKSHKPKIIAIIPARYASTRLPGKVLKDICGKPMIQHVYEIVSNVKFIQETIIATDDKRILRVAQKFGANAEMSPKSCKSGTDRIAWIIKKMPDIREDDIIINVQGDEPLVNPKAIKKLIKTILCDVHVVMASLMTKISNINELMDSGINKVVVDKNNFALYFSHSPIPFSRDKLKNLNTKLILGTTDIFYKHLGIYAYRKHFLLKYAKMPQTYLEKIEKLEQLRVLEHGYRIKMAETEFDSMSIDTPADLRKIREILS